MGRTGRESRAGEQGRRAEESREGSGGQSRRQGLDDSGKIWLSRRLGRGKANIKQHCVNTSMDNTPRNTKVKRPNR